jgi:hypothetical protein
MENKSGLGEKKKHTNKRRIHQHRNKHPQKIKTTTPVTSSSILTSLLNLPHVDHINTGSASSMLSRGNWDDAPLAANDCAKIGSRPTGSDAEVAACIKAAKLTPVRTGASTGLTSTDSSVGREANA